MTTAIALRNGELDRYLAETAKHPLLDRDEEQRLARLYRDEGDIAAAHQLVVSNLRFVVKVAHTYRGYGLKILDLVQEGNIGLMHAVKKFDPDRGYRLISYAVWWIRAEIQSYIMRSWSLVKVGSGRVRRKLFFKLRSERSAMEQEAAANGGAPASREALAERLGVSIDELSEMEVRMGARDFSLDAPLSDEVGTAHVDMLEDGAPDQEAMVLATEERQILDAVIDKGSDQLNDKEAYILEHRLLSDEPPTLAVIGEHFGVSRERIRQLEQRVIKKLRAAAVELDGATA